MLDYAKQEKFRAIYRKINPNWHDGIWHYEQLFKKHGFRKEQLLAIGDPTYIAFSRRWFKIGVALEKIIDKLFPFTKVHLVGSFKKI